ncbi:hypothetical protein OSTOST_02674 [Ostertagia ostertagi]
MEEAETMDQTEVETRPLDVMALAARLGIAFPQLAAATATSTADTSSVETPYSQALPIATLASHLLAASQSLTAPFSGGTASSTSGESQTTPATAATEASQLAMASLASQLLPTTTPSSLSLIAPGFQMLNTQLPVLNELCNNEQQQLDTPTEHNLLSMTYDQLHPSHSGEDDRGHGVIRVESVDESFDLWTAVYIDERFAGGAGRRLAEDEEEARRQQPPTRPSSPSPPTQRPKMTNSFSGVGLMPKEVVSPQVVANWFANKRKELRRRSQEANEQTTAVAGPATGSQPHTPGQAGTEEATVCKDSQEPKMTNSFSGVGLMPKEVVSPQVVANWFANKRKELRRRSQEANEQTTAVAGPATGSQPHTPGQAGTEEATSSGVGSTPSPIMEEAETMDQTEVETRPLDVMALAARLGIAFPQLAAATATSTADTSSVETPYSQALPIATLAITSAGSQSKSHCALQRWNC